MQCISAITLLVSDMSKAVSFYETLGFRLGYGGASAEFTSFRAGGGYLNLQRGSSGSTRTSIWGRVVFWVDDVDAAYARVVDAGYVAQNAPADADWGERYFHVRDPDGHEISVARPITSR